MAVSRVIDPAKRQRLVPLSSECPPDIAVSDLYFEVVYGPLIGPTLVALARNLARRTAGATGPVHVDLVDVALELGLRASRLEPLGHNAPIIRAVDRLEGRRLLTVLADGVLGIYISVPPLGDRYLDRIPEAARAYHLSYLDGLRSDQPTERGPASS